MKNISLKAIILGFLIDIAASQFIGMGVGAVVGALLGISLARNGMNPQGITTSVAFAQAITTHPLYLSASLISGLVADAVGGFAAAAFAPRAKLLNAALCGLLLTLLSVLLMASYPLWFTAISVLLIAPVTMLGGWVRIKTEKPEATGALPPVEAFPTPPIPRP